MAKSEKESAADDELRALVKGGAEYEKRRPEAKPVTASRIVAEFSAEPRTPSVAGLPKWRASGTMPGANEVTATGTDPGLGPTSEPPTEVLETAAETEVNALAEATMVGVPMELEPSRSEEATTKEAPSEGDLKAGKVITIPDGNKAEWAEQIAAQVRGGAPAKPFRASKPKQPEAAVEAKKTDKAKRSSRDEPTVIRAKDDTPEAPPVESRREEKRTELKIGVTAIVIAAVLVGVFIGRWVWTRDDGGGHAVASAGSTATTPSATVPTPVLPATTTLAPVPSGPTHMGPIPVPEPSATVKVHGPKHPGHEPTTTPSVAPVATTAPPTTSAPPPSTGAPQPTAPSTAAPSVSGFRPF